MTQAKAFNILLNLAQQVQAAGGFKDFKTVNDIQEALGTIRSALGHGKTAEIIREPDDKAANLNGQPRAAQAH